MEGREVGRHVVMDAAMAGSRGRVSTQAAQQLYREDSRTTAGRAMVRQTAPFPLLSPAFALVDVAVVVGQMADSGGEGDWSRSVRGRSNSTGFGDEVSGAEKD